MTQDIGGVCERLDALESLGRETHDAVVKMVGTLEVRCAQHVKELDILFAKTSQHAETLAVYGERIDSLAGTRGMGRKERVSLWTGVGTALAAAFGMLVDWVIRGGK
jgi:hypothetical protein